MVRVALLNVSRRLRRPDVEAAVNHRGIHADDLEWQLCSEQQRKLGLA
jgi:hypothetical protein